MTFINLDLRECPQLVFLACYQNNLSTTVMDQIYCDLPDRNNGPLKGYIVPLFNENDPQLRLGAVHQ